MSEFEGEKYIIGELIRPISIYLFQNYRMQQYNLSIVASTSGRSPLIGRNEIFVSGWPVNNVNNTLWKAIYIIQIHPLKSILQPRTMSTTGNDEWKSHALSLRKRLVIIEPICGQYSNIGLRSMSRVITPFKRLICSTMHARLNYVYMHIYVHLLEICLSIPFSNKYNLADYGELPQMRFEWTVQSSG